MTAVTVTYRDVFGPARGRRRAPKPKETAAPAPQPAEPAKIPPPSRAARMLALAYWIERRIENGTPKDYADAARRLGLTRARLTQIMGLLELPVRMQERILLGSDSRHLSRPTARS